MSTDDGVGTTSGPWTADDWNACYPVGTPVVYHPVMPIGTMPPEFSKTRSEAWELGHGRPVVKIEGRSGGIALDHIRVMNTPDPTTQPAAGKLCAQCGAMLGVIAAACADCSWLFCSAACSDAHICAGRRRVTARDILGIDPDREEQQVDVPGLDGPTTQPAPGDRVLIEARAFLDAERGKIRLQPLHVVPGISDGTPATWHPIAEAVRWRPMPAPDDEHGDRPHADAIRALRVGMVERGIAFRFDEAVPAVLAELDRLRPAPDDDPLWQALLQGAREYGLVGADEDVSASEAVRRVLEAVETARNERDGARQALDAFDREREMWRQVRAEWATAAGDASQRLATLGADVKRIADHCNRMAGNFDPSQPGYAAANLLDRVAARLRTALAASAATAPPEAPQPESWRDVAGPAATAAMLADLLQPYDPSRDESQAMLVADVERVTAELAEVRADLSQTYQLGAEAHRDHLALIRGVRDLAERFEADAADLFAQDNPEALTLVATAERLRGLIKYPPDAPGARQADEPSPVVAEGVQDGPGGAEGVVGRDWHALVQAALADQGLIMPGYGDATWIANVVAHLVTVLGLDKLEAYWLESNAALVSQAATATRERIKAEAERDTAYAAGRADAAKALRHAAEQWIDTGQRRSVDWYAEVAERGEVPA